MSRFVLFLFFLPAFAESLHYSINWPSGLSLGEATLRSDHIAEKGRERWDFSMDIDASVPGFPVRDHYQSNASTDFCASQLEKSYTHGKRKSQERIAFDQHRNSATRETLEGGGKSEISIPSCAKDPLTYIQFARRELAQGRLPAPQEVVFGALYQVRLEYTGAQTIKLGDRGVDADRVLATVKGPASDLIVEIFFSRDSARVPLMARVPLALGTFSVELTQ